MRITYIICTIIVIYIITGCKNNTSTNAPEAIKLIATHEINCENMFVVGDMLVIMNNSDNYFFDYFHLPDVKFINSFGYLSRDSNGFSMIPSPDRVRVTSDTTFISDDRLITLSPTRKSVIISPYQDSFIVKNHSIDSILNANVAEHSHMYFRSDIIDGQIYSLYYKKNDNGLASYKDVPTLHIFDADLNLLKIFPLSFPLISYAVSTQLDKLYTMSAEHTDVINVYDLQ